MYGGSLDTHVTWVSSAACQWCLSKAVVWMELHTMVLTDTSQTHVQFCMIPVIGLYRVTSEKQNVGCHGLGRG